MPQSDHFTHNLMPASKPETVRREKLAAFYYDLAKLVFAGTVLSVIVPVFTGEATLPDWGILSLGAIATYFFAYLANRILKSI